MLPYATAAAAVAAAASDIAVNATVCSDKVGMKFSVFTPSGSCVKPNVPPKKPPDAASSCPVDADDDDSRLKMFLENLKKKMFIRNQIFGYCILHVTLFNYWKMKNFHLIELINKIFVF